MLDDIHVLLYNIRYALLILLIPMMWSLWVYWAYFTSPGQYDNRKRSTGRHSHRLKVKQQASTMTTPASTTGAVALAEPEGKQNNLLDALLEDDVDVDDEDEDGYEKDYQYAGSKDELVDKLVDNVADKVAAQIEALTGEAVYDDSSDEVVDMQDLLDTIQEDSSTENEVITDTTSPLTEGEHTAAIRKASKMEEIGFHRSADDDEEELDDASAKLLDSPELAGLGAKHLERMSDLGLADAPGSDKERLRTAQLDDILGKLDQVLDQPIAPASDRSDDSDTDASDRQDMQADEHSFGNASTQKLRPVTEADFVEAQARPETILDREPVSESDSDTVADDEAGDFFSKIDDIAGDDSVDRYDEDPTIREESNPQQKADDEAADFKNSQHDDIQQDADDYDLMETVKVQESDIGNFDITSAEPEEDRSSRTSALLRIQDSDKRNDSDAVSVDITDDDLPAWARADSFDDDDDDEEPKQQKLFD